MDSGHVCVESGIPKKVKAKTIICIHKQRGLYILFFFFYQYVDEKDDEEEKSSRAGSVYTGRF